MVKNNLGFFDYLKAAFSWPVYVSGLGRMPLNYLILAGFAILGLGNPGFWLLGLAYEIGYLLFMAGSNRFQKLVQGDLLLKQRKIWKEKQNNLFTSLDGASQRRYADLARLCTQIIHNADTSRGNDQLDLRISGLNQLLWTFIKLLNSRIKISKMLMQVTRADIEREIKKISDQLTREDPASAIYRSLQGTLEIEKKRLENLIKAGESIKVVDSELDRIEKQVTLLHEEYLVSSAPDLLTNKLDAVMQSLQGTSRWMSEHNELFGSIDEITMPENLLEMSLPAQAKEKLT
jgi:hypothetical protein